MKKLTLLSILITILFCTLSLASTAKLMMQNGDSLQAKFYTSELELLTDFGEIGVDTDNIDKVVFLSDDKGRTAVYTTLEGEVFYGTILNDSVEVEVFGNKTEISKDVLKEIQLDNEASEFGDVKLKIETKTNDIFFADIVSPEIKIKTSYGTFNIPVGNIKNIKFEGTSQSVTTIELEDGNSVKGIIDNPTLALRFVFGGEININTSKIMSMNMGDFSKSSGSNGGGWTLGAEMPTARDMLMSVVIDDEIWVLGGYNEDNNNILEIYDPESNKWKNYGDISNGDDERYGTKAQVLNGKIFLAGGHYERYGRTYGTHGSVRVIDPNNKKNINVNNNIPHERGKTTVEVFNGELFILGGGWYDGVKDSNYTDIFNPQKSTWRYGSPMITARSGISSVKFNDKFYVFGGYAYNKYMDTVEFYDPKTDKWTKSPSMPTARRGTTSVVLDGKIYVMGGISSLGYLNIVEIFDPKTKKWITGKPLPIQTSFATSEVVNGKIFVIGGGNETQVLNTVQIYQP